MKRCPVCGSSVYDTSSTCFSCMYSFETMAQLGGEKDGPQEQVPAAPIESTGDANDVEGFELVAQPQSVIVHKTALPVKKNKGLYVEVSIPQQSTRRIRSERGSLYLGSQHYNDVVVQDPQIAPRHLHIYVEDEKVWCEPLYPELALVHNKAVVAGKVLLQKGDTLSMGSVRVVVQACVA